MRYATNFKLFYFILFFISIWMWNEMISELHFLFVNLQFKYKNYYIQQRNNNKTKSLINCFIILLICGANEASLEDTFILLVFNWHIKRYFYIINRFPTETHQRNLGILWGLNIFLAHSMIQNLAKSLEHNTLQKPNDKKLINSKFTVVRFTIF